MVRSALRCGIPGIGRLCDVDAENRSAEVEFLMEVPRTAKLPVDGRDAVLSRGFLKGFVDLLIRRGNSWWVLDWKTNLPTDSMSVDAYDAAGCAALMEHHRYELQYELYLLALCRTLSSARGRSVDWEKEIGGAAYLFVRGTREEDSRGVHTGKPEFGRMEALASAMGLEGVIS
jgi:ATP-dependent exoDNAse (exonuclease V) beta subunit